ncbi:MAG: MBL fold metallo-hydrolase [Deltaproteobacteria bacterium]|nr:MBL fold metallo-hydrolase [Deltaproteobacteria bacterium]
MNEAMILEAEAVGPLQTNAYVVGCARTKKAAVIDPGDEASLLLGLAETHGLVLEQILITHGHVDHVAAVGAVKAATGARVLINDKERMIYETCAVQGRMFGIRVSAPPRPDGGLEDGDVVQVGELRARVIATPGHSPGGVSFHFAEQRVVFVGDTLFQGSIGRTDLPGGSLEQLLMNIHARLMVLPDDTRVLCGHGPATTIGVEKRSNPFVTGMM